MLLGWWVGDTDRLSFVLAADNENILIILNTCELFERQEVRQDLNACPVSEGMSWVQRGSGGGTL